MLSCGINLDISQVRFGVLRLLALPLVPLKEKVKISAVWALFTSQHTLNSASVQTAIRTLPRPHTAIGTQSLPAKSGRAGKEETSYGADFSSTIASARPMHRIGAHVFGNDPANDAYYNRKEHGTYLLREALSQKPGKAPSWA